MKLIVAVNKRGYIGRVGKMMWKSSADFKHFKEKTIGGTLIVGRTTFEECLGGKDLPGRDTVIVGTGYNNLFHAVQKALKYSASKENQDIWVIGGSQIYDALIHLCSEIHISYINNDDVGDCKFRIPDNFRGDIFTYQFDINH